MRGRNWDAKVLDMAAAIAAADPDTTEVEVIRRAADIVDIAYSERVRRNDADGGRFDDDAPAWMTSDKKTSTQNFK